MIAIILIGALFLGGPEMSPAKADEVARMVADLRDTNAEKRAAALRQLQFAVGRLTFPPDQRAAIVDALRAQIPTLKKYDLQNACFALVQLGREQEIKTLTDPSLFRTDNPEFVYILWALDDTRAKVPPDL